ncbi:hypothetical protein AgCh_020181 [Apium graveolens]
MQPDVNSFENRLGGLIRCPFKSINLLEDMEKVCTWSDCFRDRVFHSRNCLIGVFSTLETSFMFSSLIAHSDQTFNQYGRRDAIFF